MIYTFTINGKPKALKAENLENAVEKIIRRHLWSFADRKIHFVCSNDPDAPKEEMELYTKGLFDYTRMRPVSN